MDKHGDVFQLALIEFFQIVDQQWGGSLRCDRQLEPLQILDLHRKACETKILQALRVSGPSSWGTPQAMVYRKRTSMKKQYCTDFRS